MKINDIIHNNNKWSIGRSGIQKIYDKYRNEDCIIAYAEESMCSLVIIKTKKKRFALAFLDNDLDFGGYRFKLASVSIEKAISLLGNSKNTVIINTEEIEKIKSEVLLNAL